uniref:Uncharacterized protein n=1 Tax=Tanacetum cinerariifolium TaxID=118510 RepID=A0A6L2ND52_TANCI|nr:hypothetical protein [Tanacetum cinerariifolium]
MKDIDWAKVKIIDEVMEGRQRNRGCKKEDMALSIMKEKYLSMVEFEKGKAKLNVSGELSIVESKKGKAKLMVSNEMVEYVLAKYGKNWNLKDEIVDVILEDLAIKAKQAKDDIDLVDANDVDLENKIKNIEEDFSRMLKAKEAKEAEEA